ncbi:hypothetical protein YC2023_061404 [Brassica napus]
MTHAPTCSTLYLDSALLNGTSALTIPSPSNKTTGNVSKKVGIRRTKSSRPSLFLKTGCPNHPTAIPSPLITLILNFVQKSLRKSPPPTIIYLREVYEKQFHLAFQSHNDANRALMSSNMQRQAVPLSRSEKCIVGTGLERQVALDSGVPAIAEHEGKILYTDIEKIILSGNENTLSIPLIMYQRSNKNTCMHQKPQVRRDKCIKKGQILADGSIKGIREAPMEKYWKGKMLRR